MERTNEPVITRDQITKLVEDVRSGNVMIGEQSIIYSDYMTRGDVPMLQELKVKVPGMKATYDFSEYTSYCRKMQQPDFGHIIVTIIPNQNTIEMKSLRDYLIGYRDIDIFQEEVCANTLIDIVRTCNPKFCQVRGVFTPRGAMKTEAVFTYYED